MGWGGPEKIPATIGGGPRKKAMQIRGGLEKKVDSRGGARKISGVFVNFHWAPPPAVYNDSNFSVIYDPNIGKGRYIWICTLITINIFIKADGNNA